MPRTSKRPLPRHILRISERRRELGLTQEELARMAGFSTSLMAKIERGAVDPRTLSVQYLVGLARALGLPLSALLDQEVSGDDLAPAPFRIPVYTSWEEVAASSPAAHAYLTPEELPRGADVERLAYLSLPGKWLVSLDLPFPLSGKVWVLTELRPLFQSGAVYLGRVGEHTAFFTDASLHKSHLALYPLDPSLPVVWPEEERPEVLGLVRGWKVWL
jgi:transcriptional regulator with XRE-family HTH domain